jgi:SAM-dependent methyltransferase
VCTTEGGNAAPFSPDGRAELLARFGQIDIYLFDQLLRGRITPRMRVLDAGCGEGRNSHFLMRSGGEVFGIDADPTQIDRIRALAAELAPGLPATNFVVGRLDALPFDDDYFSAVLCSAVLHFARDETQFERMVSELWRVLDDGGVLFARLASSIGIEDRVRPLHGRTHRLPDGSDRFLVDEEYLLQITADLGGRLLDPLKTTNVQNLRAMTTWVVAKGAGKIAHEEDS